MIKRLMEEEVIEGSEEELKIVRDIFRTITKTVKTFSVYPKDNPIYQKFAAEVFEKFGSFFELSDELRLEVKQYSLLYKSGEVFHSDEKTDNIAMLLYADGLREIEFYKGISTEEITDFIDILRLAPKAETEGEDDIVTLLWEKNIRNMGYTAVEDNVDDNLVLEESLHMEDVTASEADSVGEGVASPDKNLSSLFSDKSLETLPVGGHDFLEGELPDFEETALLDATVELFFLLFSKEINSDAFPEAMHNFGKILGMRMQKKELEAAIRIMEGLREISTLYGSPDQVEALEGVFRKASGPENLAALFESPNIDVIRRYLMLLDRNSITDLVGMLGELQDRKKRRLLCDVLAEIGKRDVALLSEALDDDRWYLVRNIVMILGMTRDPGTVTYLNKPMRHDDFRVRREAVRALDGIHSEETKKLLLAAASDSDIAVRISALKALRRFSDPALFHQLKRLSSRDELRGKTFAEKKETLETLAVLGGEEALPILSDLLKKRWLIEKDDMTELRASAAYGLGLIGTQEALSLIEKETESRKSVLREACIQALKTSRRDGIIGR